jgi:hypothetical protein
MRCSINDNLIRRLKGQCFILTQGQSIQGTVWGILEQRHRVEMSLHDLQACQEPRIQPHRSPYYQLFCTTAGRLFVFHITVTAATIWSLTWERLPTESTYSLMQAVTCKREVKTRYSSLLISVWEQDYRQTDLTRKWTQSE